MSAKQYKNPPIEEAVCEFTFASASADQQFDFTLPGRLKMHHLMAEYSGQPRTQNVRTIAANDPSTVAVQTVLLRVQLPTPDGRHLISIGRNTLAITVLRPYEGWTNFKPRIEQALNAFLEIVSSSSVVRIGVKYVNRIEVPRADANATEVLTGAPAQDKISQTRLGNFTQFAEFVRRDGIKVLVTQATLQPSAPNTTEYLLDIDTIWDHKALGDRTEIVATAERLHDIEGAAFESLITEQARRLFDAG
ncbi:MAG: TIGR04255 family protein [Methylocella sp.]